MAVATISVSEALKRALDETGMTQADLARATGWSRPQVNRIIKGNQAATIGFLTEAISAIDSPRLAYEIQDSIPELRRYRTADLCDQRVDLAPVTVAAKLLEELREALEPADELRMILTNKPKTRNSNVFSVSEYDRLVKALMQIIDIEPAVRALVASIHRHHGIDAGTVYEAHRAKLAASGYVRG